MKIKYLWFALLALTFVGCDDTTNSLGLGMLPDSDKVSVGSKSYEVTTRSILVDRIYAKTNIGYVGKFTDTEFGTSSYEGGFLSQLNCVDSLQFPFKKMVLNDKGEPEAYATELILYYSSYFGDSLNTCKLSVYELDKNLEKNHYTDIDPTKYYSKSGYLGSKAYTAVDLSLTDSIRGLDDYVPFVRLTLDNKIGQDIINKNKKHPEYFYNSKAFIDNVFKGIYVKSDLGDGTILYVDDVFLNVAFKAHVLDSLGNKLKKKDGTDSIEYLKRTFSATKEIIQANSIKSNKKQLEELLAANQDATFIKSPTGIFTEATLPLQSIANELAKDTLNSVRLTLTNYAEKSTNKFSMAAPTYLLMVRAKEVETFFEKNQLVDNISSFYAKRNAVATNQYVFSNLAKMVSTCIAEKAAAKAQAIKDNKPWDTAAEKEWEEKNQWDRVVFVPVKINVDTDGNIISVQHDLKPSYAKLKGGKKDKLELKVVYSTFAH